MTTPQSTRRGEPLDDPGARYAYRLLHQRTARRGDERDCSRARRSGTGDGTRRPGPKPSSSSIISELRTPAEERPLIAAGYETDAAACAYESVLAPSGWPVVFCNSFTSDLTLNRLDWPLGDSTNDFASSQRRIAYGKYIWDVESFTGGVLSPLSRTCPQYPISI